MIHQKRNITAHWTGCSSKGWNRTQVNSSGSDGIEQIIVFIRTGDHTSMCVCVCLTRWNNWQQPPRVTHRQTGWGVGGGGGVFVPLVSPAVTDSAHVISQLAWWLRVSHWVWLPWGEILIKVPPHSCQHLSITLLNSGKTENSWCSGCRRKARYYLCYYKLIRPSLLILHLMIAVFSSSSRAYFIKSRSPKPTCKVPDESMEKRKKKDPARREIRLLQPGDVVAELRFSTTQLFSAATPPGASGLIADSLFLKGAALFPRWGWGLHAASGEVTGWSWICSGTFSCQHIRLHGSSRGSVRLSMPTYNNATHFFKETRSWL